MKIRILKKGASFAKVEEGDVLEVKKVEHPFIWTEAPRIRTFEASWCFHMDDEDVEWEWVEP